MSRKHDLRRALTASGVRGDADDNPRESQLELFKLLARVFSYGNKHAAMRNWLIVLVVIRSILLPAAAWAIGAIINGPITNGDLNGILWATLGFGVLILITQIGFHFRIRYALQFGEEVIHDLREAAFEHLLRLRMDYFDRTKVGRIIGRLTSDLDAIRVGVQDIVFVSLVQGGQMLVSAALMAWYDWVLFLIVLAIAPVIWRLNLYFKRRITEQQRKGQESFSRVTAVLAESVNGVRVTQGFVRQDINKGFFRELVTDHSRFNLGAGQTTAIFLPLLELNSQIFVALLIVVGGYRAIDPEIARPVGDIVYFFFLANLFFEPIRLLGNQYSNALSAMVGAERVFSLIDTKPTWEDAEDARDLEDIEGTIEFRDVSFSYDGERTVLNRINFIAEAGTVVALVGHTGSGKTSVVNLVSKLYLATEGVVAIDGVDIRGITSDSLHRRMAMVPQHSFLFEGSVMDNIRFARPEASARNVIECVRRLDCLELIEALPDGFHTQVGEGGKNLSVGQRQVVAFARAMMVDPRILILDEATSAIDVLTEARLQRAVTTLIQDRTCLVVAHRLSTIRAADLILVMDSGWIVEWGRHDDLVSRGGVYAGLNAHFRGVVPPSTGEE